MWIIAKIKNKELSIFKKELLAKVGSEIKFYNPKIMCEKYFKNKLKKIDKYLLESYIFCINSNNNSVNFVSSRGVIIDSKGKHMREFGKSLDKKSFLKYMTICHPSSLHHKSLFEINGYYD